MPLLIICNMSPQVSPESVCEVSAQNTPQVIYYIILKMPICTVAERAQRTATSENTCK